MRTVKQLLLIKDKSKMSVEEYCMMHTWIKDIARYELEPVVYAYLLGWWVLSDPTIPLSPKEAGFE